MSTFKYLLNFATNFEFYWNREKIIENLRNERNVMEMKMLIIIVQPTRNFSYENLLFIFKS